MLSLLLLFTVSITACSTDDATDDVTEPTEEQTALTEQETTDLLFLMEEEKLARDVYLYAQNEYNEQVFKNIASSEQKHMDAIAQLLSHYGLENPSTGKEPGEFVNATLQSLYTDLTERVDASLLEALQVGATIEDLDLNDLSEVMSHTTKTNLIDTYETLTCGSGNHMRAFYGQIEKNAGTYVPQYISEQAFDEVIQGAHQNCGNL